VSSRGGLIGVRSRSGVMEKKKKVAGGLVSGDFKGAVEGEGGGGLKGERNDTG